MFASVICGCACIMMPVLAFVIINQSWAFYIPILDVLYKPWRFFLVFCSLPGFISAIALLIVPESPKFLLSQGKDSQTLEVLEQMHRINTGHKNKSLNINLIMDDEDTDNSTTIKRNIFQSMWDQTIFIFREEFLRKTVIAFILQFAIFVTANGVFMWFPDILNRLVDFMNSHPGQSMNICNILKLAQSNSSESNVTAVVRIN